MKIAAIGDLHLEKPGLVAAGLEDCQLKTLDLILEECYNCDVIILLGDVCDKPSMSTRTATNLVKSLSNAHSEIHAIIGNHDYRNTGEHSLELFETLNTLNIMPNINVYSKHTIKKFDGLRFEFLPFPLTKPKYSKGSICVGHFSVVGAKRDNGSIIKSHEEGVDIEDKNKWIMGHVHLCQHIKNVLYPGTPYQTNFGEGLQHGWLEIEKTRKGIKWRWNKLKQPVFELITLAAEEDSSWSKLERQISEARKKPDYEARYQVAFMADETKMPESFLTDNPEVIKARPISEGSGVDLKSFMKREDKELDLSYNITDGLSKFMQKRGIGKRDRVVAKKLVMNAVDKLTSK